MSFLGVAVFEIAEVRLTFVTHAALLVELHRGANRSAGFMMLVKSLLATGAGHVANTRDDRLLHGLQVVCICSEYKCALNRIKPHEEVVEHFHCTLLWSTNVGLLLNMLMYSNIGCETL